MKSGFTTKSQDGTNMKNKKNQKNQKKDGQIEIAQLKQMIRGMMVTSPPPWTIQDKTGDIIDGNGRFVARVGWGIEKFKSPVDQNNREMILAAVEFYMNHKAEEAKKAAEIAAKTEEKPIAETVEIPSVEMSDVGKVESSVVPGSDETTDEPMVEKVIEDVVAEQMADELIKPGLDKLEKEIKDSLK